MSKSLIERIIRADVRAQSVYAVPDASGLVKLDAMENPYTLSPALREELGQRLAAVALNRYPVPSYVHLKQQICRHLGVPTGFDVMLGNGSDELISILSLACTQPGAKVLAPEPGFVMYQISARLAGLEYVGVPLRPDFTLDLVALLAAITEHRPAITYLAYPNNPTGTLYEAADIEAILQVVGDTGIVVLDEAYQPFAQESFMSRLPEFDNLVVMRTVSKLGLAGIRLGYMAANAALLQEFDKVRPPYNINVLTQAAAEFILDHSVELERQAGALRMARAALAGALAEFDSVEVFPSAANFLLIRLANADKVFVVLLQRGVLVKNAGKMHPLLQNCLRVTVSTPEENAIFLAALKETVQVAI